MKRFLKSLSVLIMALTVALTAASCRFIDLDVYNQSGGGTGLGGGLNSVIASAQVDFTSTSIEDRRAYSLPEAVEKVERTSVAIEMIFSATASGSGSGVIIDVKDADNFLYIITCHHVIDVGNYDDVDIKVYIPDEVCSYENQDYIYAGKIGSKIYADQAVTLVGGDNVSDIAVIKIDLTKPAISGKVLSAENVGKLQKAVIPTADYQIRKGESIFAIGNPLGELPGSVADGVVSYPERVVTVGEVGVMNLMQISVTTNPGNSGGGLYNLYGELIGITNAGNTNYTAINFAIPIELSNNNGFVTIAKQLISTATATNYGYVSGRWNLGVMVKSYQSYTATYPVIEDLVVGGNAALAGLKKGDIIIGVEFNEKYYSVNYSTFSDYMAEMRTTLKQGDSFKIKVAREVTQATHRETTITVPITVCNYVYCNTGN